MQQQICICSPGGCLGRSPGLGLRVGLCRAPVGAIPEAPVDARLQNEAGALCVRVQVGQLEAGRPG